MSQLELLPPPPFAESQPSVHRATPPPAGGGSPTVLPGDLAEQARRKYLSYALSVITSRAIPDVRDGLKPVHRRILYTMWHDLRLTFEARHRKSAKVVGDVIGKYHPHGDSAVYDAMVRLAQDFAMRVPLIDGQGNFGSIDGDSPAAYRYTEAKLSQAAGELLAELGKETVGYRPTYDGTGQEPIVLPARVPQLLINGSTGIAVGMATSIPPHNPGEVIRACIALIDAPNSTVKQLMRQVKGPDFPTGGQLVASRSELAEIYTSGKGNVKLRGQWKLEEGARGSKIVITSIPYGVQKSALVEEIGNTILSKKLPALVGVQDFSTTDVRVELDMAPKATVDPELVVAYLYKHTRLQVSVKMDMTCLVPTDNPEIAGPARLDLKQVLRQFLDFRFETVRRRHEYELRKLRERIHTLEGFEAIFDDLDRAIRIIRKSEGKADAAKKLMKAFGIDELQADAILEIKLYRLAKIEIQKIRDELAEKRKLAKKIAAILKSKTELWNVVKRELEEVATRYADTRRTRISDDDVTEEFTAESFIVEEDAMVLVTRDGWVKRQRNINLQSTRMRDGDAPLALIGGSTRECVVFFSNRGSAYVCRINDVPASTGHGIPVQKLFKFKDGERVVGATGTDPRFMPEFAYEKPDLDQDYEDPYPHFLAVSKNGYSVRFTLWLHAEPSTSRGRQYARPGKGDEVVSVFKVYAEDDVCAVSKRGKFLCCSAQDVNLLSGAGKGVIFMKVDKGDEIMGAFLAETTVVVHKSTGGSEKVTGAKRETTGRGGKGRPLIKRGTLKRVEVPLPPVPNLEPEED